MLYRLPFKLIPRTMIRYGNLRVAKTRSWFPKKTGISRHCSPHTILKQHVVDFNKELVHSFRDYVQATEDHSPKNNNFPRSSDCIYLRAADQLQGGNELMDLAKGMKIC